jgi:hypothetical protein
MRDPFGEDLSEVALAERDQPVQALSPYGADQPFTERIRLRRLHERFQDAQTHGRDGVVHGRGKDPVAVVHQIPMRPLAGDRHAELLDRPRRCGMLGHIPMDNPSRANVEDEEDIEDAERGRDVDEDVTAFGERRTRSRSRVWRCCRVS